MEYRKLGRTDIEVSTIALGCATVGRDAYWGPQREDDSLEALHVALDLGINFFDTAESYGEGYAEELLGRVLSDRREEIVIATKVSAGHLRPDDLRRACEGSLRRLRTDYIDLYQIHWPSKDVPIQDSLAAMERLRDEGKIRAVGVSNFDERGLTEVLRLGRTEVDQVPYCLLFRAIECSVAHVCVDNEVSILPYSPLAQGLLTGKYATLEDVPDARARTRHFSRDGPLTHRQESGAEKETFAAIDEIRSVCSDLGAPMAQVSLAWLLSRPAVPSVLAGARNGEHVRTNAGAADLKLSQEMTQRLTRATEDLKRKLGPSIRIW